MGALRASAHPQGQFLWAIFRDIFHYAAVHLEHVADNARDLDLAMRWGFGWAQGPFETWQAAGWSDIAQAIAADPTDELPDDAVSFDELTGVVDHELLPDWYMPRPGPRARIIDGWRRRLVVAVVGSVDRRVGWIMR